MIRNYNCLKPSSVPFDLKVNIAIPPANEQSDIVVVRGTPANVARGVEALQERIKELDLEQEDRVSLL